MVSKYVIKTKMFQMKILKKNFHECFFKQEILKHIGIWETR
jgi:hypothetical protein